MKQIISDRGDIFYLKFTTGNDFGQRYLYCKICEKSKGKLSFLFPYKKLGSYQREISYSSLDSIPLNIFKKMTEEVLDLHYSKIENGSDFEKWDGFMGDEEQKKNFMREIRIKQLLEDD